METGTACIWLMKAEERGVFPANRDIPSVSSIYTSIEKVKYKIDEFIESHKDSLINTGKTLGFSKGGQTYETMGEFSVQTTTDEPLKWIEECIRNKSHSYEERVSESTRKGSWITRSVGSWFSGRA